LHDAFSVYWWHHHGAVVVVPQGLLDARSYRRLRTTLAKVAAEEPRAVVVDVDELRPSSPVALALFPAVRTELATWPGLPLLLIATGAEIRRELARYHMARYLPVHTGLDAAVAAIAAPPHRELARLVLPAGPDAPRPARAFVRAHCHRWHVTGDRATDAILVVNELVENAVRHTTGAPGLRLELRADLLTVAFYDGDPGHPRLLDTGRVHGLTTVDRLCRTWGSTATTAGGKVVWAAL
jgi:hypothetical protein